MPSPPQHPTLQCPNFPPPLEKKKKETRRCMLSGDNVETQFPFLLSEIYVNLPLFPPPPNMSFPLPTPVISKKSPNGARLFNPAP